jgi:transcription elongation factor Elf1
MFKCPKCGKRLKRVKYKKLWHIIHCLTCECGWNNIPKGLTDADKVIETKNKPTDGEEVKE